MQKALEKAYEEGKATAAQVLDGVMALGMACMWIDEGGEGQTCCEKGKCMVHDPAGGGSCQEC